MIYTQIKLFKKVKPEIAKQTPTMINIKLYETRHKQDPHLSGSPRLPKALP